jgi:hypothetical protein
MDLESGLHIYPIAARSVNTSVWVVGQCPFEAINSLIH